MDYVSGLIHKHASKGVVVDTNLLLVFLIGAYDTAYLEHFKKTSSYTAEDYELLRRIVKNFPNVVVTPNILTEVSNLTLDYMTEGHHSKYFPHLISYINGAAEQHTKMEVLIKNGMLIKFGFTDTSILETAQANDYLVITDDLKLYAMLQRYGVGSININHLRTSRLLSS